MELLNGLSQGWHLAIDPLNIGMVVMGVLLGSLVGSISGLRAIHGVALFLPLTYSFNLPVSSTMIFLLTVYYASEFGRQSTADSQADSPEQQRQLTIIQTLSGIGSFCGGMAAIAGLVLSVALIKQVALRFGPAEYFALVIFAIASLSIRAGRYPFRTLISTVLGLMIATVGIDSTTGVLRFTFDEPQFFDGIEFSTVVIGLFVVNKLFTLLETEPSRQPPASENQQLRLNKISVLACKWAMARSAVIGFIIGILPGGGTILAGSFSSQVEKTCFAADRNRLRGKLKEIVARETANSAAVGGAMVPLLALGIPGSGTAAILLGALLLHNITPGPGLFTQHSDMVWSLILSMCFGNLMLLGLYWPITRLFCRIRQIPGWVFGPILIVMSFIGVFSINESSLSLLLMLILGGCAFLLEKWNYPLPPLLLGFVLGEILENTLRRALAISGGDMQILYASTISRTLWALTVAIIIVPLVLHWIFNRSHNQIREG